MKPHLWTAILCLIPAALLGQSARVTVFDAQLTGTSGITDGKLVVVGDQMVFVDDERPQLSFAVGKNDVRRLTFEQGALTVDLGRPFTDRWGSRTNLVLRTAEPQHVQTIVSWAEVPLVGTISVQPAPRTDIVADIRSSGRQIVWTDRYAGQTLMFDARHDHASGNCTGKLVVRDDGMAFESVGEADHSRSWKYAQIEELERNRSENKIIIDPYSSDDDYTLKFTGQMDEAVFQVLTDRIVANRPSQ
jgi:hypothetical protein